MSEDKKPETVESAVIEYMDEESKVTVGKELGKTAVTLTKTINTILLPIQATVYGVEKIKLFLSNYLENKLKNIPIENITPPKGNIAGPAIENLKYLDDSKEDNFLKEMYANLIANAMNKETKESVHPAFVEIIKQMDPNDILLIEAVRKCSNRAFLSINQTKDPQPSYSIIIKQLFKKDIQTVVEPIYLFNSSLENLERLKIIELRKDVFFSNEKLYEEIRNEIVYMQLKLQLGEQFNEEKGILKITSLGESFLKACLD